VTTVPSSSEPNEGTIDETEGAGEKTNGKERLENASPHTCKGTTPWGCEIEMQVIDVVERTDANWHKFSSKQQRDMDCFNLDPTIWMSVPPCSGPRDGDILDIMAVSSTRNRRISGEKSRLLFDAVTETDPATDGGVMQNTELDERNVPLETAEPNWQPMLLTLSKNCEPAIVTPAPPAAGPLEGSRVYKRRMSSDMNGTELMVKSLPLVLTKSCACPGLSGGEKHETSEGSSNKAATGIASPVDETKWQTSASVL
jgi:hypothetical protein